jgi:hypothetical protein
VAFCALRSACGSSNQFARLFSEGRIINWRDFIWRADQGEEPLYATRLF